MSMKYIQKYEAMLQKIKSVNRKGQYDHKHLNLLKKSFGQQVKYLVNLKNHMSLFY